MNYIILNNKKNTEIKGLIICSLPPISKPKKKVVIEEIDGADGDVITELGYQAYDKEVQIGLTYDYNIDDVIDYFNSEGVVTFSNEEDKCYKYKIIEQIDFEKLLRFKTATIKMHIQPFKHSIFEGSKTFDITTQKEIEIRNRGNIYSKPTMTIYGVGDIALSLNGNQIFNINLGEEEYITVDSEKMEAYKDTILKNRLVTGNYDNFKLNVGRNVITVSGSTTKLVISNYSRWV